jgi:cell wall-associated NlpC family hydrolase
MSQDERRQRRLRSTLSRYVRNGEKPSLADIQDYADKFGQFTVYDPRYYLYKVTATAAPNTTNSVILSGEVYPGHYRHGVAEVLEALGFHIAENNIAALPVRSGDLAPYAISTTNAATLRREPHRYAEQVNSIARGGWARVLRHATKADIIPRQASYYRPAPDHDRLPDTPADWLLVQSMEGYLGYSRKADLQFQEDYRLPDGLVTLPATLADAGTTIPAGTYVYGDPQAGWRLFTGEQLIDNAPVTDLRPAFTAEQITQLLQPFMSTPYVWGGVTAEGIDCSGFSQFFMRTAGSQIPRDAVQQATGGLIVAWGRDVLTKAQPGDLIFFARDNGRISHVAISLGGSKIIHSAGPGVHVSSLDEPESDNDEAYSEGILFARRVATR